MKTNMKKQYHIGIDDSHGAKIALLPGDPGRVETVARQLDNPRFYAQNREYTTWLGELPGGETVVVMSTGMGGPSAAICVEELVQTGVRDLIRVGTCGGMDLDVAGGDVVIATGAVRMEGTTREYVPIEFPAVAHLDVTNALVTAAREQGSPFHAGIVQCKDSFYGQHDPARMPVGCHLENQWRAWCKARCLASEMESAALFIVCQVLGVRSGCVLSVVWNQERQKAGLSNPECHDPGRAVAVAVRAAEILADAKRI